MIAVDGIPRSMYGGDARVAFAGVPPSMGGGGSGGGGGGESSGGAGASSSSMTAGPSTSSGGGQQGAGVTGVWSQMFKNSREYTVLKKVVRLLQDNRLNSGDEETAQRLQDLNRSQSESYPILKTILNVIFITTGVVLLIAVVIVIIYTSIVKPEEGQNGEASYQENSPHASASSSSSSDSRHHPESEANPPDRRHLHQQPASNPGHSALPEHGRSSSSNSSAQVNPPFVKSRDVGLTDVIKKCRFVPIVEDGRTSVNFGKLCYDTKATNSSSAGIKDK